MTHDIEAIANFISQMQVRPEHRIANCGVKSAEIAAQFREFGTAFAVRNDRGAINAVLGHDSDQDLKRAWLFGPVIADPSRWNEIAESLWDEVIADVAATSKILELGKRPRISGYVSSGNVTGSRSSAKAARCCSRVAEAARGRGVAKQMVASALRWMLAFEGIEEIELFVRDDNPVAQRVYASVGFTEGVGLVGARKLIELEPTA